MAIEYDRPVLTPIERELPERLAWFIRLRWMAAAGTFIGAWLGTTWVVPNLSPIPLYGVGVAVFCYNGLFVLFDRWFEKGVVSSETYQRSVYVQIGLDWASLFFLVHYTGGIQSPISIAFAFHLIIGAMLLSRRDCYVQTLVVALLLGGLTLAEGTGIWTPVDIGGTFGSLSGTPMPGFYHWLRLVGVFSVATFLTASITGQLREKEEELFRSERALDQAYTDLKALSEERAWFTRMTTHQLRSPLAAIQGMLDGLPYIKPLSEKQADFIARCHRRVEDLLILIRDLLDLASAQRVLTDQKAEPVVLLECLEGAVETARERAQAKDVRVVVETPAEPVVVHAQPDDIERIFSNLLDNGVKYTPEGGQVTFRLAHQNNYVRAEVVDTGIGIDKADQEKVFGGYYRTEVAKATEEMGTGLGLSIVKQLVERWGGNIELQSTLGQGSRFIVTLPSST